MCRPAVTGEVEDVQPRIPRQPAHERDGHHRTGDDAELSDELAAVVASARRRAVRDGDRQVDTAHLLHTLLESDPDVRAAFGDGPHTARLFGYLVQRSIGYGLRWQSGVEECGVLPPAAETEGWSPLAAATMNHARARALLRGDASAHGVDLLVAIVSDPGARAVEVLAQAGIDLRDLLARLGEYAVPGRNAGECVGDGAGGLGGAGGV